jgi:hypothetical protein
LISSNVSNAETWRDTLKSKLSNYNNSLYTGPLSNYYYYSEWSSIGNWTTINSTVDNWITDVKTDPSKVSPDAVASYDSNTKTIYVKTSLEEVNDVNRLYHEVLHAVGHYKKGDDYFSWEDEQYVTYMSLSAAGLSLLGSVEELLKQGDIDSAYEKFISWKNDQKYLFWYYNLVNLEYGGPGLNYFDLKSIYGFDVDPFVVGDHYYAGDAYGIQLTPEPISSILFLSGGAVLTVRHWLKRKRQKI